MEKEGESCGCVSACERKREEKCVCGDMCMSWLVCLCVRACVASGRSAKREMMLAKLKTWREKECVRV